MFQQAGQMAVVDVEHAGSDVVLTGQPTDIGGVVSVSAVQRVMFQHQSGMFGGVLRKRKDHFRDEVTHIPIRAVMQHLAVVEDLQRH